MSTDIHGLRIYPVTSKTILRYLLLDGSIVEDSDYECLYCGLFQHHPTLESITNQCYSCHQENIDIQIIFHQLSKIKEILKSPTWVMIDYESEYKNIQKLFLDSREYASDKILSEIIENATLIISECEYFKLRNL